MNRGIKQLYIDHAKEYSTHFKVHHTFVAGWVIQGGDRKWWRVWQFREFGRYYLGLAEYKRMRWVPS